MRDKPTETDVSGQRHRRSGGRRRKSGPRYTLVELLTRCDASASPTAEDRAWLDQRPVGRELI